MMISPLVVKVRTWFTLVSLAVFMSGCGGGENDGGNDNVGENEVAGQSVSQLGVVRLGLDFDAGLELGFTPEIFGAALFQQIDGSVPVSEIVEEVFPATDSCRVPDGDQPLNLIAPVPVDTISGRTLTPISAGETVLFSNQDGTFATLTYDNPEELEYWFDGIDANRIPLNGYIADITGDQFPAFSNVAFPSGTQPVTLQQPEGSGVVESTTQFVWEASNNPNARVLFEISTPVYGENGIDIDRWINLDCVLLDDGEYSFDPEIQSLLGADFQASLPDEELLLRRVEYNLSVEGDAALFAIHETIVYP